MSPSAEDVIRSRKAASAPPPPPFKPEYEDLLQVVIPAALRGLERADWRDGDLALVARLGGATEDTAVWKLSATMYLSSSGSIAIKVVDPLGELKYAFAEVDLDYLVKYHSNRKTVSFLRAELSKLANLT